jgi:chromosome segregation ATPase
MTATTTRKPITLADLDREELLKLALSHTFCTESDLVWAQWEVAITRTKAASDAAITFLEQLTPASRAFDAAHTEFREAESDLRKMARALKKIELARAEYRRVEAEYKRLSTKVDRLRRHADRLQRLYQELPR